MDEELYQRIVADHAAWRGKTVKTKTVVGGNGDESGDWAGWIDLPKAIEVTVVDRPITLDDTDEHDCEEAVDTYYPIAEVGPWSNLKHVPDDVTGKTIDGPTYHYDGRVGYPSWWPKPPKE